ncbi:hypothetical protein GGR58DRAFT_453137 [Xylaria digitata]|nr:hypothetical protein GGR58DRAFT_453137 [Xylaria digitata]
MGVARILLLAPAGSISRTLGNASFRETAAGRINRNKHWILGIGTSIKPRVIPPEERRVLMTQSQPLPATNHEPLRSVSSPPARTSSSPLLRP